VSFDKDAYLLARDEGDASWFLDTRMTLKAGANQTGGAFTLFEFAAPNGFAPPLHVHADEDEGFYVLDGELIVHCGELSWIAGPDSFVFLPRGIAHSFVVSRGPVRALQITSPSGFEDFVNEVGRAPKGAGLPEPEIPDVLRLAEISGRHGYEIVGPPPAIP
jgi:mannose-6-phosphate isomerase-like protein (cupin superfamily)